MNEQDIYSGIFGSGVGLSLAPRSNVSGVFLSGNGTQTVFPFSNTEPIVSNSPHSYDVIIHGVGQVPTDSYTVSVETNSITFTEAPPEGTRNIYIRIITQAVSEAEAASVAISGYLSAVPEETPVPKFSGIGGPFNAQAQALLNTLYSIVGIQQFTSYEGLRAYTGGASAVDITGYLISAKPSKLAGRFVLNLADNTSEDNGGTIIVDALGRRWFRSYDGYVDVTWFGVLTDGTDQTSQLLTVATKGIKLLYIPYGVSYNRGALLTAPSMPDDVVFFDMSGINDFSAAGESTKHFGIVSKDSAPDDTHWAIDSGHHAILALNNFGAAGSTSATERKATVIWNVGQYRNGTAQQKGFRGAALLQFTKESTSNRWVYQLRSLAPWQSIAGEYEEWRSSEVVTSTATFRISNGQQYRAATTGTTGATPPSHTSGTVSDGGVSWTWIDSADRSVVSITEEGRILIGAGDYGATFRHKVGLTDTLGDYVFEGEARGTSKTANFKLLPTDGIGDSDPQPYLRAESGEGLRLMKSDSSGDVCHFTDDAANFKAVCATWKNAPDLDATPSVAECTTLWVSNSSATSITTLDDPQDGQIVKLVFSNSNTTLVHSSSFMLSGSVNVTPTQYSSITFERVPTSISARWIETSRTLM